MALSALVTFSRQHAEEVLNQTSTRKFTRSSIRSGDRQVLRLNIGGSSFHINQETITERAHTGLLYRFVNLPHVERLLLCDSFLEETQEYFFQRPASLFEPIYIYYSTGFAFKPQWVPSEILAAELRYWGLAEPFGIKKFTKMIIVDPFKSIRCSAVRRQLWLVCEQPESSIIARILAFASIFAVLVSNGGLVLSSLEQFQVNASSLDETNNETLHGKPVTVPHPIFDHIEMICIAFFTLEYLTKLIVTPLRSAFACKIMNLIDLIAILPFYLELLLSLVGLDASKIQDFQGAILVVRILRVLRVVRLLKLGRHSTGLQLFVTVLMRSIPQLGMVMAVVSIGVMFFSTLVYFTEKDQAGTLFTSIPAAFWWCIVTVTTVGYGDMYPTSVGGKLVASFAIACGLLVLSLPITIIVDNFVQVQEEFKVKKNQQMMMAQGSDDSDAESVTTGMEMKRNSSDVDDMV